MNPSQPCTIGVWIGDWTDPKKLSPLNEYQIANSDVISFHQYEGLEKTKAGDRSACRSTAVRSSAPSTWPARVGSTFEALLPWFKEQKVGAYNWGFVAGKTNTLHGWDTWQTPDAGEPKVWFHDILPRRRHAVQRRGSNPHQITDRREITRQRVCLIPPGALGHCL